MSKEVKAAWIAGICAIIAASIGIFSIDLSKSKKDLIAKNDELVDKYSILEKQFDDLYKENTTLSEEISTLKKTVEKYSLSKDENNSSLDKENKLLLEENESLTSELNKLQNEIENMTNNLDSQKSTTPHSSDTIPDETGNKVSVFTLDTFKGNPGWLNISYYTDKIVFTDTYDTEHLTSYIGHHFGKDINSTYNPTYLLDKKYSSCEGEIAWSKSDKNSKETAWIEFYSGDELIYITEKITVDSRPLAFSFSVDDVEKITILRNATGGSSSWIIYTYLDFVK